MLKNQSFKVNFDIYEQPLKQPLKTNHGVWTIRTGIIITLTDQEGKKSLSEIAPIPWFGSETLLEAKAFCEQLHGKIDTTTINNIPEYLPCCQFAFQTAYEGFNFEIKHQNLSDFNFSYLLPTGEKALKYFQTIDQSMFERRSPLAPLQKGGKEVKISLSKQRKDQSPLTPLLKGGKEVKISLSKQRKDQSPLTPLQKGGKEVKIPFSKQGKDQSPLTPLLKGGKEVKIPFSKQGKEEVKVPLSKGDLGGLQRIQKTFKLKIGIDSLENELNLFTKLIKLLPNNSKLRLDANGSLSYDQAQEWLKITDNLTIIEFMEQPLPPKEFDLMLKLAENYSTSLALDESVANFQQLQWCYQQGWKGVFVIKPLIAGYPQRLTQFCMDNKLDVVLSSALETTIGRKIALSLAYKIQNPNRAIGFGIDNYSNG